MITGSRGDVFIVRTSKPVENLWKNGLFWSRYSFVTHSIDRKPRDWGLARSAYSIKYGKGGNKFRADFRIPETKMELNEIVWFYKPDLGFLCICQILQENGIKTHSNSFSATEICGLKIALSFAVHRNRWWQKWRSKVNVLNIRPIKGKPTQLLPHAKMLLIPIKFFFSPLGRLCSWRFYIFTEQMWF